MQANGFTLQIEMQGATGFVAVDSVVRGTSSGGLRIAADMDQLETRTLAREMSLKFSFIGLPRGGAKSGLQIPERISAEQKRALLAEFGRRLAPVIHAGIYYPGMDMNCGPEDLRALYQGAGLSLGPKVTDTSYFTAVSVDNAIQACLAELPMPDRPLTVAIEGYGAVGNYLVQRLPKERFRVVAISTVRGAVACEEGFDPDLLSRARQEYGDNLVHRLSGGRLVEKEAVLGAEVDILVPAARTWSIHSGNVGSLRARLVVPAANAPFTADTIPVLKERGILCLPGFVTNSGGVYASSLYDSGVSKEKIEEISARYYRAVVAALVRRSLELDLSPVVCAERVALARLGESLAATQGPGRLARLARRFFPRGVLPRGMRGERTLKQFVDNLCRLEGQIREVRPC